MTRLRRPLPGRTARRALACALAAAVAAACAAAGPAACTSARTGSGSGGGVRSASAPPEAKAGSGSASEPARPQDAPGSRPEDLVLGEPCPAEPALTDLHAVLWQLERTGDRAEARERAERARREIEESGVAPGWDDLAAAIERAARTEVPFSDIEELRARLHESPCLGPELHRRLHRALDDPLRWDPVDGGPGGDPLSRER